MAGVTGREENVVIIGNLYARLFSYECVHCYIGMLGREINGNSGWLVSSGDGGRVVGRPSYGRERSVGIGRDGQNSSIICMPGCFHMNVYIAT